MSYHKREIPQGTFEEFSKIEEEFHELLDAHEQGVKILELCELADLLGAIEGYIKKHFNMTLKDLEEMKDKNSEAFLAREQKTKLDYDKIAKGLSAICVAAPKWAKQAMEKVNLSQFTPSEPPIKHKHFSKYPPNTAGLQICDDCGCPFGPFVIMEKESDMKE